MEFGISRKFAFLIQFRFLNCGKDSRGAEGGHWTERSEGSGWSSSGTPDSLVLTGLKNLQNCVSQDKPVCTLFSVAGKRTKPVKSHPKYKKFKNWHLTALIFFSAWVLFSAGCASQKNVVSSTQPEAFANNAEFYASTVTFKESFINLCFAGDIMAHKQNFSMSDYSIIWDGIRDITGSADLSFANIETTVDDFKECMSYPQFRINSDYVNEAVKAGFNVFSLANNHTNDWGLEGIKSTAEWAQKTADATEKSPRPVHFSGLKLDLIESGKMNNSGKDISFSYFEVRDWKILFVAATEILNRPEFSQYMNFSKPAKEVRRLFAEQLRNLRASHECDLFILSLHTAEPEYVFKTEMEQESFYKTLLNEACVDIIWANHPHVVKPWTVVKNSAYRENLLALKAKAISGTHGSNADETVNADATVNGAESVLSDSKLIMRANGNTISGQRWDPKFNAPETLRDYTGDGLLLNVTFSKKVYTDSKHKKLFQTIELKSSQPCYITTYINSKWQFVIKKLDENFISELKKSGNKVWAEYLKSRKKIMEKTGENTIWQ